MLEVELVKIVMSLEAIKKLVKLKMSAVLAYKLSKISLKVEKEIQDYEKVRMEKAKEFGTEGSDDKGNPMYTFQGDSLTKFNDEMLELSKQVIKLDFDKIAIDEKFPELEPEILIQLDWMFEG